MKIICTLPPMLSLVSSEFITSRLSPDTSRFDQPFSW